jgi:hypothetical protein
VNDTRIATAFRTLNNFADAQESGERALLHHVLDDLRDAVYGETEVDGLVKMERDLVAEGKRINAIKEMRNRFLGTPDPRASLAGASIVVDAYIVKHGPKKEG